MSAPEILRLRTVVRGGVQGVGFRPFVFRLAQEMALSGWVNNSIEGVLIEVEAPKSDLEIFLCRLEAERPPMSFIQSLESFWLDPVGYRGFEIRTSQSGGTHGALAMPDIATCADCFAEVFDPGNRRYFYPFTNCTNCGPRFSIIESLPYDRCNTSMKRFAMCAQCRAEYDNPMDRRFHAQPNACPVCGPRLHLWDKDGTPLANLETAGAERLLRKAVEAIRAGRIVAVKGIGGFHLLTTAGDGQAIGRLRERKHREEKPFAVMFPTLQSLRQVCAVSAAEERSLRSPEAPIVLLQRLSHAGSGVVSAEVAPKNPNLGALLPYSPLHHLLLVLLNAPVVATSGNLSDEPICTDEQDAVVRLKGIADLFLVHDRPIIRHVDDSIVRFMAGREMVLRRARGYAPLPIDLSSASPDPAKDAATNAVSKLNVVTPTVHASETVLGVGAHLKNAVALAVGPQVFISQHIGDLETAQAEDAFRRVISDLQTLYQSHASLIVADEHPDYISTRFAARLPTPRMAVQHHVAHVLSCMAENQVAPPALGVSWDGTGYGLDGTVWGGEFFRIEKSGFERVAHFYPFRLPGGEKAVREPRRSALGMLWETFGPAVLDRPELPTVAAFSAQELHALHSMLTRKFNSPLTSSVGRLFDAVASLTGLRQVAHFEGQAAMDLEFILSGTHNQSRYDLILDDSAVPAVLDWRPAVKMMLADISERKTVPVVSARFHHT